MNNAMEKNAQDRTTVYISGKITGDPEYWKNFCNAEAALMEAGFAVMNPAVLPPEGFSRAAYMEISAAMLDACEAVCFLSDWVDSRGAWQEYGQAVARGKKILLYEEWHEGWYEERARKTAEMSRTSGTGWHGDDPGPVGEPGWPGETTAAEADEYAKHTQAHN